MKIYSEKYLERQLVRQVTALGGACIKLTSQYHRGLPDRLILMPGAYTCFAEVKTTGKRRNALQQITCAELEALGFKVYVVDDKVSVQELIQTLKTI
ncbi:MAG: VRR-NUC domain-containing protein [Bacteroidales bacterium]|nr:VRR-NUC domain-containing protein [Bacteroidales bacterium]